MLDSTVADWITAAATVVGLLAAGAAAYFAFRAFRLEQRRDDRAEASAFTPWWAVKVGPTAPDGADQKLWGLVLTNSSDRVLRGVRVEATVKQRDASGVASVVFEMAYLPPGQYFMASRRDGAGYPQELVPGEPRPEPLAKRNTHVVTGYSLRDSAGIRWTWDEERGLRRPRG